MDPLPKSPLQRLASTKNNKLSCFYNRTKTPLSRMRKDAENYLYQELIKYWIFSGQTGEIWQS
jgi:hypothetical protein